MMSGSSGARFTLVCRVVVAKPCLLTTTDVTVAGVSMTNRPLTSVTGERHELPVGQCRNEGPGQGRRRVAAHDTAGDLDAGNCRCWFLAVLRRCRAQMRMNQRDCDGANQSRRLSAA